MIAMVRLVATALLAVLISGCRATWLATRRERLAPKQNGLVEACCGVAVAQSRPRVMSAFSDTEGSRWCGIAVVGLLALSVAGCDPVLERRYINEGAGVDLYTSDRATQVELLNQYIAFVCAQVGPGCVVNSPTFVQAGMNDIDSRCDGFLTWLDARRRDKEPIVAEISAINTAVHSIMTVTGSSPKSLDIVTAAFGLASASYTNWNSRLLISVNQSTVQEVVYNSQWKFREKIKTFPIPDQPTAIYLLRNYLRLCMPITIEATFNTATTLVQRDVPIAARDNLVVSTTARPSIIRDVNVPLPRFNPPPTPPSDTRVGRFEKQMSPKDMQKALQILGCPGPDLGRAGSSSRKALAKLLNENGRPSSERITDDVFFDLRELKAGGKQGTCST
jgi:hypothetical protein